MTLTDQQLGRIARAADTYSIYTRADVLRCAVKGDLASALAIVGSLEGDWRDNPLMTVLRKVSEEVERDQWRAARRCTIRYYFNGVAREVLDLESEHDGIEVLDNAKWELEARDRVRDVNTDRITITLADGTCWSWTRNGA